MALKRARGCRNGEGSAQANVTIRSMEEPSSLLRRSAHALNEPLAALLVLPEGRKRARYVQLATFRRENRLLICSGLLDRVPSTNRRRDLHFVRKHFVAGK